MTDSDAAAFAAQSGLSRILGVLTTFFFLSVIIVGLRMYTRIRVIRSPSLDDILIGLAALCQLVGWILILIQSKYGLGHHQSTISEKDLIMYNKLYFCLNVVSIAIGTMLLKVSIAVNLHRLCRNPWFKWSLRFLIVIVVLYEIVGFLFFFLDCKPLAGYWDTTLNAKCAPTSTLIAFGLVNTSFNIITDVALAVLPIPIIWALNMKLKLRIYLIGILSLGYLAVAMDIVKTYYQETYSISTDETYTDNLILYGLLEEYFGLIAASVPMLRPLVGKAMGLSSADYYPYGRNTDDTRGWAQRAQNRSRYTNTHTRTQRSGVMASHVEAGYELDERETSSENGTDDAGVHGAAVYQHNAESEEKILQSPQTDFRATVETTGERPQHQGNGKGIMMTTEVTVT